MSHKLKEIEKSIKSYAVAGGIIGLSASCFIGFPLATLFEIKHDECVKCQDNGLIYVVIWFVAIPVLTFLSYKGMLKLRSNHFLKNGSVSKAQLRHMDLYGALGDDHEF